MEKIKILYIVSRLITTGPTKQLLYILKNMDRNKFEPIILTLSKEPEDSLYNEFTKLDIKINSLSLGRAQMQLYGGHKLKRLVAEINPVIIHSNGPRADYYVDKYCTAFPHIITVRNYALHDYPMEHGKLLGTVVAKIHLHVIKNTKYSVACSESLSKILRDNCGINIRYIRNGVDVAKYSCINSKEELCKKLNLPIDKIKIISTGGFLLRKDPEATINGFLESNIANESVLIMLGNGELYHKLMQKFKDYHNIIFTGKVKKVNEYLNASDLFISTSKSEGLPNAVLEAMSSKLPIILSDIPQHEEIIKLNKKVGYLYKLNDKTDLINKLNLINREDLKRMAVEAEGTVEKYFTDKRMSYEYQDYYSEIVANL